MVGAGRRGLEGSGKGSPKRSEKERQEWTRLTKKKEAEMLLLSSGLVLAIGGCPESCSRWGQLVGES